MTSNDVQVILKQPTKRGRHRIHRLLIWPPRQHGSLCQQSVNASCKHNVKDVGCPLIHTDFDQVVIAMVDPIEGDKTVHHQGEI